MTKIETTLESLSQKMSGVKWHGRYFSAQCPWHDDQHSSLMVYEDGVFCMACRKRAPLGSLTAILYKRRHTRPPRFSETELAEFRWSNAPPPEDLADGASDLLCKFREMGGYLVERGIESRIEPNRLGWWGGYFTFPVFDRDDIFQRLVLRAAPQTESVSGIRYIVSPGVGDCLYIPDPPLVNSAKKVFVVFGIIDALVLTSLRIPVVTGIHGQSLDPAILDIQKTLVIVPDLGEDESAYQVASALGWRGKVMLLKYPEGTKDPADFVKLKQTRKLLQYFS